MCSICYRNFLSKEKQAKKAEESPDSTIPQSEANTPIDINPIQQELQGEVFESSSRLKCCALEAVESVGVPPKRRRQSCCPVCKKRVGLLAFKCRCGGQFCETHRYPEAHQCSYDHKAVARNKIQDENPVVLSDKLDRV